jgi:hypothetical protein
VEAELLGEPRTFSGPEAADAYGEALLALVSLASEG